MVKESQKRGAQGIDWDRVRADFPVLEQQVRSKPLVYLDSAATAQKPLSVIEAVETYYSQSNANVHRGVHALSEKSTQLFEGARAAVQRFLGAASQKEIIFVRGATEGINLVASSYGQLLNAGDEILISSLEHHSNIVPWQLLAERQGLKIRVIPMNESGELEWSKDLLTDKTKLVAVNYISNAIGTINPVKSIIGDAHDAGAVVLIDAAQAAPHTEIDVKDLDCDFLVFSGHKAFAPTGIGALYGKEALLEKMPPYQGGGEMIEQVSFERSTYAPLPAKFEAGTPNIAGTVGLTAAIEYLEQLGFDEIQKYENELLAYGTEALTQIKGLRIVGTAEKKVPVFSFVLDGIHPHDIGTIVDQEGVAIRTGHHCAQPVMEFFQVPATSRASLTFYNRKSDIDALVKSLQRVLEVFA